MSNGAVALAGFVSLFALMLLRVPVGMAMGLVGVTGFGWIVGGAPALKMIGQTSMRTVTDYNFGVIPMFLLMGAFVSNSGMSRELFRAANGFVGHRKGGLGIATIAACGGFAAISGSSVATAATFSAVAYPEMRRYGYPQSFATGVIAAGGTLGAMLPPSTVLAVYGIITEQDIGKLFVAGILPGALAAVMYMITVTLIGVARLRNDARQLRRHRQRARHNRQQFLQIEWLGQIFEGAALGRLHRGDQRRLCAHDHHPQVGPNPADARDQVQPVLVGHHHIGDHQVTFAFLDPAP